MKCIGIFYFGYISKLLDTFESVDIQMIRSFDENITYLPSWISGLFQVVWLAKCLVAIVLLNWCKRLRDGNKKLKNCDQVLTVVQTTAKQIISRQARPGVRGSGIPIYPIFSP